MRRVRAGWLRVWGCEWFGCSNCLDLKGRAIVFEYAVQEDKEFSGGGNKGDFGRLPVGPESLVEGFEVFVVSGGD